LSCNIFKHHFRTPSTQNVLKVQSGGKIGLVFLARVAEFTAVILRPFKISSTKMKRLFIILCILSIENSCRFHSNEPQTIRFYHRDVLGEGGASSYSDILAISSYETKAATARQLLQIANAYLDTSRPHLPIDEITFMAKDIESPQLIWDSEIFDRQKKYFLISFAYTHLVFDTVKSNRQLRMITIWNHSEPTLYYRDQASDNGTFRIGTNLLDSIVNSSKPLLND
jgi:hypothetical protein